MLSFKEFLSNFMFICLLISPHSPQTSYNDLLDALRLSLKGYEFRS